MQFLKKIRVYCCYALVEHVLAVFVLECQGVFWTFLVKQEANFKPHVQPEFPLCLRSLKIDSTGLKITKEICLSGAPSFQQYSNNLKPIQTSTVLKIASDSTTTPSVFKSQSMILVINSKGWMRSSLEQGRLV